jgi:hypothetical protein
MRAEASLVHHHHIGDACGGLMEEEVQSPTLEINASRQFTSWLEEQQVSLVFTIYQAGKVFFIGLQPTGTCSIFERIFNGYYLRGNHGKR